ncbi:MAG: sulfotransferase [Candidatus Paceibacterota bacterium]
MKVIFILSAGHSGSTLLDILLDTHRQVIGVGEIHTFKKDSQVRCACGKAVQECRRWAPIINQVAVSPCGLKTKLKTKVEHFLNLDVYRYNNCPDVLIDKDAYIKTNEALFDEILKREEGQIIVDSSKSIERVELLSLSDKIEPIIVHLVRDTRAVTWSYMRKYKKKRHYLFIWLSHNIKIELLKYRVRAPAILVGYSEIVRQPQKTIDRIIRLAGLQPQDIIGEYQTVPHHQFGGNGMRFAPKDIIDDNAWRSEMPKWLQYVVFFFTGWLDLVYRLRMWIIK